MPYSTLIRFNYVENPEMCKRGKVFVYKALASGHIRPSTDRVFPMEEYKSAWDYLSAPRTTHGKVVVTTGL